MRTKQIMVPRWAAPVLEQVVFEGWTLVDSTPAGRRRQRLVYEADEAPAKSAPPSRPQPARAGGQFAEPLRRPSGNALNKTQRDALKVTVQHRIEPMVGDEYVVSERFPYRAQMGSVTYLMPAQMLKPGDRVVVRQKLPTGVWRFDIVQGDVRARGASFTVSRKDWTQLKDRLRMASEQDNGGAKITDDPLADMPGFKGRKKEREGSPLAQAGSYLRVTKELSKLPVPKKFDSFFAAPLPKRPPPPPEGEEGEGGGNPFGGFGRRR